MIQVARVIGILTSLGAVGLWLVSDFFNPYGYQGATRESFINSLLMMLLSIAGIVVTWKVNPYLMLAVFIASFFPVGFYMLGTPGIFRWIGILNVLFFFACLLILPQRIAVLVKRINRAHVR